MVNRYTIARHLAKLVEDRGFQAVESKWSDSRTTIGVFAEGSASDVFTIDIEVLNGPVVIGLGAFEAPDDTQTSASVHLAALEAEKRIRDRLDHEMIHHPNLSMGNERLEELLDALSQGGAGLGGEIAIEALRSLARSNLWLREQIVGNLEQAIEPTSTPSVPTPF